MQKGSLVVLKNNPEVAWSATQFILMGKPFPSQEVVYVMATDIREYKCDTCKEIHTVLTLEEIPDIGYSSEWFDEIQSVKEVNIEELVQEAELVNT